MSHIEENFFGEVGQKALIEKDGKILMCQTEGEDYWDFPGGRLQKDENPKDGLLREIQEELGRDDIEIGSPLYTFSAIPKSGVPRFFCFI